MKNNLKDSTNKKAFSIFHVNCRIQCYLFDEMYTIFKKYVGKEEKTFKNRLNSHRNDVKIRTQFCQERICKKHDSTLQSKLIL